jgi:hypothetical protein
MRLVSCGEATIDHNNSGEAAHACPCIYRESKQCGRKLEFFDYSENLLLTKNTPFEILVSRKMNDMRIDKKYHPFVIDSLEVIMPIVFLLLAGLLFAPRE